VPPDPPPQPVIDRDDLAKLLYVNEHGETPGFSGFAIDCLFPVAKAGTAGAPTPEGAGLWPTRSKGAHRGQ